MTLYEILARRRSCRKFTDRQVEQATIDRLTEATLTAPSSKNARSTRLAVVRDPAIIEQLGATRSYGSAFVAAAPLVVLVMADAPEGALWVENCTISATILQLMAEEEGLGSCWVQVNGRPHLEDQPDGMTAEEYIHSIIPTTAPYRIECMIALGHPAAEPAPRKARDDSDKIINI